MIWLDMTIMKNGGLKNGGACPVWSRFIRTSQLVLFLSLYATVCFLIAGWHIFKAVAFAVPTAAGFLFFGDAVWKPAVFLIELNRRRKKKTKKEGEEDE